jgi:hypothetical protein
VYVRNCDVLYAVCIQTSASIHVIVRDLVQAERMVSVVLAGALSLHLVRCIICVCVCVCVSSSAVLSPTLHASLTDTSTPPLGVDGLLRVNFTFVGLPVNRDCRIIQLRGKKSVFTVQLDSLLTSTVDRGVWSTPRPGRFTP